MAFIRPGIGPGGMMARPVPRVIPRMGPRPIPRAMPGMGPALGPGTGGGPGLGDLRSARPTGPPIMRKKGGGVESSMKDRKQDRMQNLRKGRSRGSSR